MQRKLWTVTWTLVTASLLVAGCGSRIEDKHGSESHFLTACDDTCGGGLSCIDNRCTRACDEEWDCTGLNADAVCLGSDQAVTDETPGGVCDLGSAGPCEEGGLHYALGDQWACSDDCNTCYCTEDGVESTAAACVDTCEDNGTVYQLGDEWECSDGCNTCFCGEEGIENTDIACTTTCEYEGMTYTPGDEWECSDGCNTCTCLEDGSVGGTEIDCTLATCSSNGVNYQIGETIELGAGATCVCLDNGLLGQCTGLLDDGGPTGEPTDGGPTPDPNDRSRCDLPPDSGDCDAAEPGIYFDAESGQCLQFIWGGCGGNANRFDSLGDCYTACGRDAN